MPELTLQEIQAITELAEALYSFLPATAYPYSKPKVDFGTVARDVGIGNLWPGGSKLPAIQTLLEATLRTRRDRFCPLMIRITKEGLKYRNKKSIPITQEEMNRLNQLIVGVGFKIPELVDPKFISSLPKAKSNSAEIRREEKVPSKISLEKVENITNRFLQMETLKPQERGYEFEKLLYDLFDIYRFNPRPSFKNIGEQIDGSIEFENQYYLIEAKWQMNPINEADILVLDGRVSGHSGIGRGIFLTCGSFSREGIAAYQRLRPSSIFGIDGQDLYLMLEQNLPLNEILRRKVRWLVDTGDFHYPVLKFIGDLASPAQRSI